MLAPQLRRLPLPKMTGHSALPWSSFPQAKKINSAGDNAAGLAISSRMTSQIRGLGAAISNANDAISMVSTAEGALDEITAMMQRMRELAVQAGTGTTSAADRTYMNSEFVALVKRLIASLTTRSGMVRTFLMDRREPRLVNRQWLSRLERTKNRRFPQPHLATSTIRMATCRLLRLLGLSAATIASAAIVASNAITRLDNTICGRIGATSNIWCSI